jgi:hypothetical protein
VAGRQIKFAAIGLVVGAVAGFVTRPSLPMVGQLPFGIVITRGADLKGLDQFLTAPAQDSFNHCLWFMVFGGVFGFALPAVIRLVKAEVSGDKASAE